MATAGYAAYLFSGRTKPLVGWGNAYAGEGVRLLLRHFAGLIHWFLPLWGYSGVRLQQPSLQ